MKKIKITMVQRTRLTSESYVKDAFSWQSLRVNIDRQGVGLRLIWHLPGVDDNQARDQVLRPRSGPFEDDVATDLQCVLPSPRWVIAAANARIGNRQPV